MCLCEFVYKHMSEAQCSRSSTPRLRKADAESFVAVMEP